MSARVLDGRELVPAVKEEVRAELAAADRPGLGILRGDDEASATYARRLEALCQELGVAVAVSPVPKDATTEDAIAILDELAGRDDVTGVIVQVPLPDGVDENAVVEAIDPAKDADAVNPATTVAVYAGRPGPAPATAMAVMELLDRHGIDPSGMDAVVLGRSLITGKPLAMLLLDRNATVTICHSRTRDLADHTRRARLIVCATGRAGLLTGDMVSPEAIVVDVGTNYVDGKLVGDVAYDEVAAVAEAVSPVPGGVGPLTNLMLLRNVARLTRARS
jgi:methylenetetrahydrofolate dehydrogenase (NADP+)/methenyltetrahydrofolate cyclohydrolase